MDVNTDPCAEFGELIQKHRSQLGFVTYLLNCPRRIKGERGILGVKFVDYKIN
jgi:hypothetical protein